MTPEVEPEEVGFDRNRLRTLDRHFARYVDDGRLAGWQIVLTRRGRVAHASTYGLADREAQVPVARDTLWRIYSMTKPITTVAAMLLWEEGRFQLTDEISRWLPEFADVRVYDKGSALRPYTVPAVEPIRVWHLLSHTAGLTYGFLHSTVVDGLYRQAGFDGPNPGGTDLATACKLLAGLPLLFQPGTAWGYSVATDVLGRLIEVVSGQDLRDFIAERILRPLDMTDTHWWVREADAPRLAALYAPDPATGTVRRIPGEGVLAEPELVSGGGGLISSAADYHRFTQMLLRSGHGGGDPDGVRLLARRTVGLMTANHLPGGADLARLNRGGALAESILDGVGFGLGFAIVLDPLPSRLPTSRGEYYWGGVASTSFWVDPAEELTAMLFTQLMPSSTYPLRPQLRQLVYSALL